MPAAVQPLLLSRAPRAKTPIRSPRRCSSPSGGSWMSAGTESTRRSSTLGPRHERGPAPPPAVPGRRPHRRGDARRQHAVRARQREALDYMECMAKNSECIIELASSTRSTLAPATARRCRSTTPPRSPTWAATRRSCPTLATCPCATRRQVGAGARCARPVYRAVSVQQPRRLRREQPGACRRPRPRRPTTPRPSPAERL